MPEDWAEQVRRALRDAVRRAGTQKAVASRLGISTSYLSMVLAGQRLPGPQILRGLGYDRRVTLVPSRRPAQPLTLSGGAGEQGCEPPAQSPAAD